MRTPPTVLPPPPASPSSSSSSSATAAIVVAAAATQIIHLSPPLSSSTTPTLTSNEPHQIRWRHYSGTKDFEANAALVLIILLCALICALALNASIRCFLRGGGGGGSGGGGGGGGNNLGQVHYQLPRRQTLLVELQRKTNEGGAPLESAPALVYSAGMKTKLAGDEAECVICLSEFVEGEEIRVLSWCKHGFHSQCIQEWFSSHSSCPTCRRSFHPPSPPPSSAVPERSPVGEALTDV